jgi:type I restriction enzyme S subunit
LSYRYRKLTTRASKVLACAIFGSLTSKIFDFWHHQIRHLRSESFPSLTGIDTAIEKTEALIAKYQQIKAGLMRDLFTRGVLPNGQLRPSREQAPELYQETAIGWIPREWEVAGLAAKGRPGTHWIRTGPFGSALKGEHWRTHGHPVITIGALGEGVFTDDELLFVDSRDAARLVDFQLKAGDVVFSRVADVGRSVVVRAEQAGWIMSSNLMRIAVDENRARPDLVQMALASDSRIKAQIRARVNSGGRDVANSDVLNQLRFVWPDIEEQDRIIERANTADCRITSEKLRRSNLLAQKQGLMHDLLTGKVSVKIEEPEVVDG